MQKHVFCCSYLQLPEPFQFDLYNPQGMEMVKTSKNPGGVLPIETCICSQLLRAYQIPGDLSGCSGGISVTCQDPSYRPKHRTCTREMCEVRVEMENI